MLWRDEAVSHIFDVRERALAKQPTECVALETISRQTLADDIVAE